MLIQNNRVYNHDILTSYISCMPRQYKLVLKCSCKGSDTYVTLVKFVRQ